MSHVEKVSMPISHVIKGISLSGKSLLMAGLFCQSVAAGPFTACPSEAFLVQDTIARLYGVELATGHYQQLSNDMGVSSKLNAIAFNFHDKYLYSWNYATQSPARIDDEYQVTALGISGLSGVNFYVGDIAIDNNIYYVYRPGSQYGLYAISLDETQADYLSAVRIVDGSRLNLRIFDMAFHPHNGFAYSVDANGWLHRIDVETGDSLAMNQVGQTGTFGAVYFDLDENLYISRNNDGYIFRIDINSGNPQAELFAYGPSSSNNDGARCALAPVIAADEATIDFGDAPVSYGTRADDNGARHNIKDSDLFFGDVVDAEFDSHQFPLSDDETLSVGGSVDDEDGIDFVTGIEVDSSALLQIKSSAVGFVNAWIDFDGNGSFSDDERILNGHYVSAGNNVVSYSVPSWAEAGSTWARFRLSSTQFVGPQGGVSDGEVEDYSVDITESGVSVHYYPSASEWATIAFEDNWPLVGDYDFTDLVVNYRLSEYVRDDAVIRVKIEGQIAAVGASYHNGFAFHLPGVVREQVDESHIRFLINNVRQGASPLEANRSSAIVVVADDVWDFVSAGENCKYHRTEVGCGSNIQMRFSMMLPLSSPVDEPFMPDFPYDPFMFATDGFDHGYVFGLPPGRAYEIHLPNKSPTEAFRMDFLNRGDDRSDVAQERFFVNENGMPWAINVGMEWRYPIEYMDVIYAYPLFPAYIASEGQVASDWYVPGNANLKNTFSD